MGTKAHPTLALALLLAAAIGLPTSARAQVTDHQDIEFPPLGEFEIPTPEVYDLDNGLKVFLLEDHELPLIQAIARIRTGSVYEPEEKTGLARMMGVVQRTGGTDKMSGDEIDDFLESRAASVETIISTAVGFASMDCLTEDFDEVFPVFRDILASPRFSDDKLELAKVQANTGIARRNDDVLTITSREFSRLVYGPESPLSRLEEYATIGAIDRQDLLDWQAKYFHPNNIYLGVVGDFDSTAMKRTINTVFGGWRRGEPFVEGPVAYQKEQTAGVYFIEKTDVTQANIRMGHLGITVDNPDYFAVEVMNEVLGGGFSGRLLSRIRSDRGLAYSVRGGVRSGFVYPGLTDFGLQTKSESMAEAVDALFKEVRGMDEEPVTEEEMERAKETILNSFIFNYASKSQVLSQQMLYSYYGLPLDFLENYRNNIERVNRDDVQRVAEEYLDPDHATLLVVGKSEDFDRPVATLGEVTELDISIPPPPTTETAVERTAEAVETGRAMVATMGAALGGDDVESLEGIRSTERIVVSMGGQSMAIIQSFVLLFPDTIHTTLQTPMGEQLLVIQGGEGFVSGGGQVQTLPQEKVMQQLEDVYRDPQYIARYRDTDELEAVAAGEGQVGDAACRVVEVTLKGSTSRLWVDVDGKVHKQTYQSNHPFTGAPGNFEVFFSDYREVEGLQVPFARETKIDGQDFATATTESYEVNPEVDPALFERPAA